MKPLPFRNLRARIQPIRQDPQLVGGDLPLLDPIQEVLE